MADIPMWVITENPTDFPGQFVARKWVLGRGYTAVTDAHHVADTLDAIRETIPAGMSNIGRQPNDEPVIVECWI